MNYLPYMLAYFSAAGTGTAVSVSGATLCNDQVQPAAVPLAPPASTLPTSLLSFPAQGEPLTSKRQGFADLAIANVMRAIEDARENVRHATGRVGLRQLATALEREAEMLREELRRSREVGYETAEE